MITKEILFVLPNLKTGENFNQKIILIKTKINNINLLSNENSVFFFFGRNRINIKANPSSFKLFLNIIKRDINLNLAIFNSNEILELYYT